MVSLATALGVALGMAVVGSILIVDYNSSESIARYYSDSHWLAQGTGREVRDRPDDILSVYFLAAGRTPPARPTGVERSVTDKVLRAAGSPASAQGEEDYHAMRIAVRLTSVLAFAVGAITVFFTLRYSVAARASEFSLLLCLGERRATAILSLVTQALVFGVAGTAFGTVLAIPIADQLLQMGISTTGRIPSQVFTMPWAELSAMAVLSVGISIAGVVGPAIDLHRLEVVDILQPRSASADETDRYLGLGGLTWLVPIVLGAAYIGIRPFLASWLSIVHFFAFEAIVVAGISAVTLWTVPAVLRLAIAVMEWGLKIPFPLEVLLAGRRMRFGSRKLVFTVASVTMVFSLVTCLQYVTGALKREVQAWTAEAASPYTYFGVYLAAKSRQEEDDFVANLRAANIEFLRLSPKLKGPMPVRMVVADDINARRAAIGKAPMTPGDIILSRALAARYKVRIGDQVLVRGRTKDETFTIIDVGDSTGYYAEFGPYVALKSYALITERTFHFSHHLEPLLGKLAMARSLLPDGPALTSQQLRAVQRRYVRTSVGLQQSYGRSREIDRDFLIFDFILSMTVLLAAIGVANSLAIQVHARRREFAILRSVGISRWQCSRLLIFEGLVVGCVSAGLALFLGALIGASSVEFLDRFTLFDYEFAWDWGATGVVSAICIATCLVASIYPAFSAARVSGAEALHYE